MCRLLSLKLLVTTPYHPISNGLIEQFNGTFKNMLRDMCAEKPKDLDRYIGPLLFAYKEVKQDRNTMIGERKSELLRKEMKFWFCYQQIQTSYYYNGKVHLKFLRE